MYLQRRSFSFSPDSTSPLGLWQAGDDPSHQAFIRSLMKLGAAWSFEAELRQMGALPNPRVPGYIELDAHLGWQANAWLNLSLTGTNLLHAWHQEYVYGNADQIGRSLVLSARIKF